MHLGTWHHLASDRDPAGDRAFATHLHGRDLEVDRLDTASPWHWHWRVATPHGTVLAEGDAVTRDDAESAAEEEALAVHPPTEELIERLLA